jgi:hypothetical protein
MADKTSNSEHPRKGMQTGHLRNKKSEAAKNRLTPHNAAYFFEKDAQKSRLDAGWRGKVAYGRC